MESAHRNFTGICYNGQRNKGGGNGGGTRVAARAWFEGGLAWGCVGEVHPSLYRGVGGVWEG
jgi:hypothetical protein